MYFVVMDIGILGECIAGRSKEGVSKSSLGFVLLPYLNE